MSASAIRHAAHAALDAYAADERAAIEAEAASDWDAPLPFDGADVPPFPVDALPDWLVAWVRAEADALQVPPDLPAVLGLSTAALCLAKRVVVQVNASWQEPVNLYAVAVLRPGEGKSPAFGDAVRPVQEWEAREAARMRPIIAQAEERARQADERKKHLRSTAAKSKNATERERAKDELRELAVQAEAVPRAPRMITADATPEAIVQLLAEQGGRLGVFSDEGGPFEIAAGRYSEGGRGNFEVFLQAHSGSSYALDRVSRASIRLRAPVLTMALTVQPHVVVGLAAKDGFRGRGLLARFLYCLPRSRVGSREANPSPVPVAVRAGYERAIGALLAGTMERDDEGEIVSRPIRLTADAHAAFVALRARVEPRLGPGRDLEPMADWMNKLPGLVLRLAGLLHVADRCVETSEPIEAATMARAIAIGDFAIEHACAAFGMMGADPADELAKRLLAWATGRGHATFTRRDAQRALHANVAEADAAIAALVERGYVRALPVAPPTGGRPSSPAYEINPRAKR